MADSSSEESNPPWLVSEDNRILRKLDEVGVMTLEELAGHIGPAGPREESSFVFLVFRCRELRTHGLVQYVYGGYEITPLGRQFVRGDLDETDLVKQTGDKSLRPTVE